MNRRAAHLFGMDPTESIQSAGGASAAIPRIVWAGLAALPMMAGCRSGPNVRGSTVTTAGSKSTLRYPITLEPATLDPACVNETPTIELLQNVYDGLILFDSQNRIVPGLARTWDISANGLTYTFHLRSGVRFHNGRPFSSADVKYSLERALWKETRSGVAANYLAGIAGSADVASGRRRDLEGVSTPDSQTVTIRLSKPRGYFLGELAYPTGWIVCRAAIEQNHGQLDEVASIGTGPFKLASYRHGYGFVLDANAGYWGGRPKLDRIERPVIRDPQSTHLRYENGEIDICGVAPNDDLKDVKNPALRGELRPVQSAVTMFVVMQPSLVKAFADTRVRRAIALAIDRAEIVRVASHGLWTPAASLIPPGFPGFNPRFRKIPYDPAAARSMLASAGYPEGAGFPRLTLVFAQASPELSAAGQIIRDNLKANLGISIDLQEHEAGTLRTDVFARRVPFALTNWGPDYIDPQNFLSLLLRSRSSLNFSGYANPEFDALCDRADAESDMAVRIPLYQKADQIAMDDVAVLPLYYANGRLLAKPYVHDWSMNLMSFLPHTKTWIDSTAVPASRRK